MSTPLTASAIVRGLRAWGLSYRGVGTWQTHNRNHKGPWGPVNGVMVHHTGSNTSAPAAYARNILYSGYSGLPGPLCQFGVDDAGLVYLTGNGRSNHAGRGDGRTLSRVIAEDPSLMSHEARPTRRDTDGNTHFYGIEVMYSGSRRMTEPQRSSTVRLAAMLCRAHGWGAASVIGHKEWTNTKWDPGMEPMTNLRQSVAATLDNGDDDDMANPSEVADAVLNATVTHPTTHEAVTMRESLRMALVGKIEAAEANAGVAQLRGEVDELTKAVHALVALERAETL